MTIVAVVVLGGLGAIFLPGMIRNYNYSRDVISDFTDNNKHEWVDMGTSVKWATCNVGASSPTDPGAYFAWGETKPKRSYEENNCITYGKDVKNIEGNSKYDAASANWGGNWRMPTKDDWEELIKECTWTWKGRGYEVKSNATGNSIYLPAASRPGSPARPPSGQTSTLDCGVGDALSPPRRGGLSSADRTPGAAWGSGQSRLLRSLMRHTVSDLFDALIIASRPGETLWILEKNGDL